MDICKTYTEFNRENWDELIRLGGAPISMSFEQHMVYKAEYIVCHEDRGLTTYTKITSAKLENMGFKYIDLSKKPAKIEL